MKRLVPVAVVAAFLSSMLGWAQDTETSIQSDWLDLVVGGKDNVLGAETREVEVDPTGEGRTITIAIPKKAIKDLDDIEEVVVVGRRPEKIQPLFDVTYEWVKDYDDDNYGLVIRFKDAAIWPIRLQMNSVPGYLHSEDVHDVHEEATFQP